MLFHESLKQPCELGHFPFYRWGNYKQEKKFIVVAFPGMLTLRFTSKTRGTSAPLQGFALPTPGSSHILRS